MNTRKITNKQMPTTQPRGERGRFKRQFHAEDVGPLREQGWTNGQIAEYLGTTTRTVESLMPDHLKTRKMHPRITEEALAKAKILLEDRSGYDEAARSIGCSNRALARRLPGYALTREEVFERMRVARLARRVLN